MSADLPTASAVETPVIEEKESPIELFLAHMTGLEQKLAAQKELTKELEKDLSAMKKLFKKVAKLPRAKREGVHPKGETPSQVAAWNAFLKDTLEVMKSEGWPAFEVTDKKGNTNSYPAGVEEDGAWVWDYEDAKKRVAPNYKTAMSYASYRKANGEFVDPGAAARQAVKEAKAAEREAEKAKKAADREAAKAGKAKPAAAAAKGKAAGGAGKEEEKPVAKATKAAAAAKASKPVTSKAKAKPAPAPVADEDDEDALTPWTFAGKNYFRSGRNECWLMTAGGKQGKWAGVYDPETNKIDTSAPEPEVEFE